MMNRLLKGGVALVSAVALSATLAACSGKDSATTQETTLKVWIMGDDGSKFEKHVEGFTSATGIKVDVDAIPWDNVNEKLTTAVASGNGPDVMQIGLSLLSNFQTAGALADLSPSIGAYPNLKS